MERLPSDATITIDATDIAPEFVDGCAKTAKEHGWPVKAQVMRAQNLDKFEDHRFTHSFTNFAFHRLGDLESAAREVYRTLRPGGTAVVSIWTYMPHEKALQQAHWRTRGQEGPMLTSLPLEPFREEDLKKSLMTGGFKGENIKFFEKACYLKIADLHSWAQLA